MEAKIFSPQEWEDMARLYVRNVLTEEGVAIVEYQMEHYPDFRRLVILELAIYDQLNKQEHQLMVDSIKSKAERIRKEREQQETINRAKEGIRIFGFAISNKVVRAISVTATIAACVTALVIGFDNYKNSKLDEELARAREHERQRIAIAKQRLQDSLAHLAKNQAPISTSIGSNSPNIATNSQGKSLSSGVAKTNSGQSRDSVGLEQVLPLNSGNANQTSLIATIKVFYQEGGNSFSGDQSNRSITVVLYQINTSEERYTLESNTLTIYLSKENLNKIMSNGTNNVLVRKANETRLYIRKNGKEILKLQDEHVFPID